MLKNIEKYFGLIKWKILVAAVILSMLTPPLNAQDHLLISRTDKTPRAGIFLMAEHILQEAYTRLGIKVEFRDYPRERAIRAANNGDTDGDLQRTAGLEQRYPNLVMVPFTLTKSDVVVFTKKKTFQVTGYDSLKPYSILITIGSKPSEQGTQGMRVTAVATTEQAFRMLEAGRADVFIYFREGICVVKKIGLTTIKILEPPLEQDPGYHYLNKRHRALVPRLVAALKDMEREGVIQRLQQEAIKELRKTCY
jgi:polar amino acid transport system substrate-binding protein